MSVRFPEAVLTRYRRRHSWRRAWSLYGPLLPIGASLGVMAWAAVTVLSAGG